MQVRTAENAEEAFRRLAEDKPDLILMKVVVDELKNRGLRDKYIVLVGGAPLNEEFGRAVGADAYCRDAAIAAETARNLVAARRASTTAA